MEKKTGRPRVEIDKEQFEKLCQLQCTEEEIAGFFDCSADTINRWCKRVCGGTFENTLKKFSSVGHISLRRAQFQLAEKSATMAIFLGKQYLGQRDQIVRENQGAPGVIILPAVELTEKAEKNG